MATPSITEIFGDRVGVSIDEFAKTFGISKGLSRKLIASGALQTYAVGRRRLVTVASIRTWFASRFTE